VPAKAGTQQGLKIAGGSEAQINKTDRNDARGIALMMRVGLYRPIHVKTLRSQKTADAADPSQAFAVEGLESSRAIRRGQ